MSVRTRPPGASLASSKLTERPAASSDRAQLRPAKPAPMTTTWIIAPLLPTKEHSLGEGKTLSASASPLLRNGVDRDEMRNQPLGNKAARKAFAQRRDHPDSSPATKAGCPIQARFWLEWDATALDAPFFVIQTPGLDRSFGQSDV